MRTASPRWTRRAVSSARATGVIADDGIGSTVALEAVPNGSDSSGEAGVDGAVLAAIMGVVETAPAGPSDEQPAQQANASTAAAKAAVLGVRRRVIDL